jgi:hypothetical protein
LFRSRIDRTGGPLPPCAPGLLLKTDFFGMNEQRLKARRRAPSSVLPSLQRDLVGYADQPSDPRWPGGARLALNFVVNYEEGGERSVLHGDKVAETRLTDLLVPAPLQSTRDLNADPPTVIVTLKDGNSFVCTRESFDHSGLTLNG